MKKIFAFYPPGGKFQRGEDRCQASIDDSVTVSQRACNDLGYIAAISKNNGMIPFIKDYPSENLGYEDMIADIKSIKPDIALISTTIGTLPFDSEIFAAIKKYCPDCKIFIKGAFISTLNKSELDEIEPFLENVDFAAKGEIESVFSDFLDSLKNNKKFSDVRGLVYKSDNVWYLETEMSIVENLDLLPFPDRSLINNSLYIRPDTGEAMATIESSRGCPSSCIYCLTPVISGKKTRFRSPESIVSEITECIEKYNIKNFFFRSDTFTINHQWVDKLCALIIENNLNISWVANARVKPLNFETLKLMKKAGCWLIAFGFESGSPESLSKMKKGATIQDALKAADWAKKAGLQIYGFFMFGFPWETEKHFYETLNLAIKIDCDYAEFHIATAFKGTQLYEMLPEKKENIGKNYFSNPNEINPNLTSSQIITLRKKAIRSFYIRPAYILKKILRINNFYQIKAYFKYGLKMLKIGLGA